MKCQTPAPDDVSKFCGQCGEILPTLLVETTGAARKFIGGQSDAEQAEVRGQQKWKSDAESKIENR